MEHKTFSCRVPDTDRLLTLLRTRVVLLRTYREEIEGQGSADLSRPQTRARLSQQISTYQDCVAMGAHCCPKPLVRFEFHLEVSVDDVETPISYGDWMKRIRYYNIIPHRHTKLFFKHFLNNIAGLNSCIFKLN